MLWQAHWKFVELQKSTDQPAVWLKEVLLELGHYHKKGPYLGTWGLKNDWKDIKGTKPRGAG